MGWSHRVNHKLPWNSKISRHYTCCYAAIFGQTLQKKDIHRRQIHHPKYPLPKGSLVASLDSAPDPYSDNAAWRKAIWAAALIYTVIPSVRQVGITGSLAVGNIKDQDDIDFCIVCQPGTVWFTRFFVWLYLRTIGVLRRKHEFMVKGKICCNLFIETTGLAITPAQQNLYTAHEVVFFKPVIGDPKVYADFLKANRWARSYLPYLYDMARQTQPLLIRNRQGTKISLRFIKPINDLLYLFQVWWMGKDRGPGVTRSRIAFYPTNRASWVASQLTVQLSKYDVPLDRVFFSWLQ